jgi:hypothetical protein
MRFISGQAGVESLVTYGVVVMISAAAVIYLSQTGVFRQVECEKYRVGFSEVVPADWGVYREGNNILIHLNNWASYPVEITGVNVSLRDVTCAASTSVLMDAGGKTLVALDCSSGPGISDRFLPGECFTADVSVYYINRVLDNPHQSKGKLLGSIEEGEMVVTSTSSTTTTTTTSTTLAIIPADDPPVVELISPGVDEVM